MILIRPDHHRRIDIPGVPAAVRRPVDIDQSITGFTNLRTLRIYRFDQGSLVEGHAEEDEVLIVVLDGTIELTMIVDPSETPNPVTLSAPGGSAGLACAAYLPPDAAYKLLPRSDADVAYARATPTGRRLPLVFSSTGSAGAPGVHLLLEDTTYAERLRFRLVSFHVGENDETFVPIHQNEVMCEGLIHVRTTCPSDIVAAESDFPPIALNSWDTLTARQGESPNLQIAQGSSGLALIVMAG